MGFLRKSRQRELSRFELAVIVIALAILVVFFWGRVSRLMVTAEATGFSVRVSHLRTALRVETAERLMLGSRQKVAALEGSNPMSLVADRPADYLGEMWAPDPATIPRGKWYFDLQDRVLVYRVLNDAHFETALAGPKRARLGMYLDYTDANENGTYEPAIDAIRGVRLRPREPYAWVTP